MYKNRSYIQNYIINHCYIKKKTSITTQMKGKSMAQRTDTRLEPLPLGYFCIVLCSISGFSKVKAV